MNSDGLTIMRLVLAAINGVLFAFGAFLLMEFLWRRPRRLRERIRRLIVRAETQARLEETGEAALGDPSSRELREQIEHLREMLRDRTRDPRFVMNVSFGALMIVIAIYSLLSLLFPGWLPFA